MPLYLNSAPIFSGIEEVNTKPHTLITHLDVLDKEECNVNSLCLNTKPHTLITHLDVLDKGECNVNSLCLTRTAHCVIIQSLILL